MLHWSPIDMLQEVLMDVPDLVFAFTEDGRYLFVNHAASEFLGSKPCDVIGMHWQDMDYPAEIMAPFTKRVAEVARTGDAQYYRVTSSPQRGSRTFDISLTPLWSEQGHVLAVLAIAHDISEFFPERMT